MIALDAETKVSIMREHTSKMKVSMGKLNGKTEILCCSTDARFPSLKPTVATITRKWTVDKRKDQTWEIKVLTSLGRRAKLKGSLTLVMPKSNQTLEQRLCIVAIARESRV